MTASPHLIPNATLMTECYFQSTRSNGPSVLRSDPRLSEACTQSLRLDVRSERSPKTRSSPTKSIRCMRSYLGLASTSKKKVMSGSFSWRCPAIVLTARAILRAFVRETSISFETFQSSSNLLTLSILRLCMGLNKFSSPVSTSWSRSHLSPTGHGRLRMAGCTLLTDRSRRLRAY